MAKTLLLFTFLNLFLMFSLVTAQKNSEPVGSDPPYTFEQFQQALPDSIVSSVPSDSLKTIFKKCLDSGLNMPVFKPDTSLTASMPQIKPEKVDEEMIIPWFKGCSVGNSDP